MMNRRQFVGGSAAALAATPMQAQSRVDVGEMERGRVLTEAKVESKPSTLVGLSAAIANLSAAFVLTKEQSYADRAAKLLAALIARPAMPADAGPVELVPIAEVAVAIRFLGDAIDLTAVNLWLTTMQLFLTESREMRIARDTKDHRASCWLLLASCIARSQKDEKTMDECRHRFKSPTLRNQLKNDGTFPEELATANPYRNTLFNFDLLAGVCQILSGPFDDLWGYELQDGPGMRSVAAFVYPVIKDRGKWGAIADAHNFHDLPGRRAGLVFAGRAYKRPEYVELYRSLPGVIPVSVAETFPVREPLLWTTRAAHGL